MTRADLETLIGKPHGVTSIQDSTGLIAYPFTCPETTSVAVVPEALPNPVKIGFADRQRRSAMERTQDCGAPIGIGLAHDHWFVVLD